MDSTDLLLYGASEAEPTKNPSPSFSRNIRNQDDAYFSRESHLNRTFPASQHQPSQQDSRFGSRVHSDTHSEKRDMKTVIERLSLVVKDFVRLTPQADVSNRRDVAMFTPDDFLPPMDSMMSLKSSRLQRDKFFDEVEVGDVFCCSIVSINNAGLDVVLLCYACKRNREIDQLKLTASCSSRDIPELLFGEKKEVSDVYSVKDKVTGVVIGLSQYSENIQISLLERDLPRQLSGKVTLGLTRSEELPQSYRTMCMSDDMSYHQILQTSAMFQSPGITDRLCKLLSIDDDVGACSLLSRISRKPIKAEEKAASLRKQQSKIHALHSVVEGVKLYKEGKQREALALYNKALDIDSDNVEALVARGAMYANNESYQRALEDFKHALKVHPGHQNALDYTVQTLLAYARDLDDIENSELAIKCYKEILVLDPSNVSAQQRLTALVGPRAMSADQQPIVSSTRGDLCSPSYSHRSRTSTGGRQSKDSPTSSRHSTERRSSRRSRSVKRRRRSILSDRRTSRDSGKTHNEERIIPKRSRYRSTSHSSFSSSDSGHRRSMSRSPKRKSHSKLHQSRQTKHGRSSSSSSRSPSSRSRSPRRHSMDRDRRQEQSARRKAARQCSSGERRGSSSRSTRRISENFSKEGGGSPYVRKEPVKDLAGDAKKPVDRSELSSSPQQAGKPAAMVEDRSGSDTNLDRYGFPKRDNSKIDIFSNLTAQPATPVVEKKSTVTSFLPYCLTTDPLNKTQAKKIKGSGKSQDVLTVKSKDGKQKSVRSPGGSEQDKNAHSNSSTKDLSSASVSSKSRKRKDSSHAKSRRRTKSRSHSRATSRSRKRTKSKLQDGSGSQSRLHGESQSRQHGRTRSRSHSRSRSRSHGRRRSRSHSRRSRSHSRRSRSHSRRRSRSHSRRRSRSHGKTRHKSHRRSPQKPNKRSSLQAKKNKPSNRQSGGSKLSSPAGCDQVAANLLQSSKESEAGKGSKKSKSGGDGLSSLGKEPKVQSATKDKVDAASSSVEGGTPPAVTKPAHKSIAPFKLAVNHLHMAAKETAKRKAAHHQDVKGVSNSNEGIASSQFSVKVEKKSAKVEQSPSEKKEKQEKLQKMEDFLASLKHKKTERRANEKKS